MCTSLFLHLADTAGQVEIDYVIPKQVIKIKNIRLQFDTVAHSIQYGICYLDVPWLGPEQLVDNNGASYRIPIQSSGLIVSLENHDMEINLTSDIEKRFVYAIYDQTGTLIPDTDLLSCDVQMEFCLYPGSHDHK